MLCFRMYPRTSHPSGVPRPPHIPSFPCHRLAPSPYFRLRANPRFYALFFNELQMPLRSTPAKPVSYKCPGGTPCLTHLPAASPLFATKASAAVFANLQTPRLCDPLRYLRASALSFPLPSPLSAFDARPGTLPRRRAAFNLQLSTFRLPREASIARHSPLPYCSC